MLLNYSWYKFQVECYNFRMLRIIPMVTTKKTAMEYTQKEMRKEFKCLNVKIKNFKCYPKTQLNKKEDSNAGNERKKNLLRLKENK